MRNAVAACLIVALMLSASAGYMIATAPRLQQVTVDASTPLVHITFDGKSLNYSFHEQLVVGSSHVLAVPPNVNVSSSERYHFESWSDGVVRANRTLIVPSDKRLNLSAEYGIQYLVTVKNNVSEGRVRPNIFFGAGANISQISLRGAMEYRMVDGFACPVDPKYGCFKPIRTQELWISQGENVSLLASPNKVNATNIYELVGWKVDNATVAPKNPLVLAVNSALTVSPGFIDPTIRGAYSGVGDSAWTVFPSVISGTTYYLARCNIHLTIGGNDCWPGNVYYGGPSNAGGVSGTSFCNVINAASNTIPATTGSFPRTGGGHVHLSTGEYDITTKCSVQVVNGEKLTGDGYGTLIKATHDTDVISVKVNGDEPVYVGGLQLQASMASFTHALLLLSNPSTGTTGNEFGRYENIDFITTGFSSTGGAAIQLLANNTNIGYNVFNNMNVIGDCSGVSPKVFKYAFLQNTTGTSTWNSGNFVTSSNFYCQQHGVYQHNGASGTPIMNSNRFTNVFTELHNLAGFDCFTVYGGLNDITNPECVDANGGGITILWQAACTTLSCASVITGGSGVNVFVKNGAPARVSVPGASPFGLLSTPFISSHNPVVVGFCTTGCNSNPTASTTYAANVTPVVATCTASGGTPPSITIKDSAGNVYDGISAWTCAQLSAAPIIISIGYTINYGAFTGGSPTFATYSVGG